MASPFRCIWSLFAFFCFSLDKPPKMTSLPLPGTSLQFPKNSSPFDGLSSVASISTHKLLPQRGASPPSAVLTSPPSLFDRPPQQVNTPRQGWFRCERRFFHRQPWCFFNCLSFGYFFYSQVVTGLISFGFECDILPSSSSLRFSYSASYSPFFEIFIPHFLSLILFVPWLVKTFFFPSFLFFASLLATCFFSSRSALVIYRAP